MPWVPWHTHLIGHAEGFEHGGLLLGEVEQAVIGDDDQGVDVLGDVLDPLGGGVGALATLEGERLGDDAHGERTHIVLGDVSDPRGQRRFRCRHPRRQ